MSSLIQCCSTNLLKHKYVNKLIDEKNRGATAQVEGCLGNCGICRDGAYWLRDGQIEKLSASDYEGI
ncbi:MAG TPA: hypothetical protein VGE40_12300 [Bacilli bacterium]